MAIIEHIQIEAAQPTTIYSFILLNSNRKQNSCEEFDLIAIVLFVIFLLDSFRT